MIKIIAAITILSIGIYYIYTYTTKAAFTVFLKVLGITVLAGLILSTITFLF